MITGNGPHHKGVLSLTINNNVKLTSKMFYQNAEVINECFSSLDSIALLNPTTDAWAGQIIVTRYGKQEDIICISGCSNNNHEGRNEVVVDGNTDSSSLALDATWCFNGNSCIFKPKGKES